jgi:hypothetical protein
MYRPLLSRRFNPRAPRDSQVDQLASGELRKSLAVGSVSRACNWQFLLRAACHDFI